MNAAAPRTAEKGGEYRSPPKNLEAEQALLGAILVNNEAIHLVSSFLEPEHFFLPVHGRIYDAVGQMVERREEANPVTLKPYFENDDALKEAGGAQYLARLAGSAVTVINAGQYGRAIYEMHARRQLIAVAEDMQDAAYDAPLDQPPAEQAERAVSRIHVILQGAPGTGSEGRSIDVAGDSAIAAVEKAYQTSEAGKRAVGLIYSVEAAQPTQRDYSLVGTPGAFGQSATLLRPGPHAWSPSGRPVHPVSTFGASRHAGPVPPATALPVFAAPLPRLAQHGRTLRRPCHRVRFARPAASRRAPGRSAHESSGEALER